MRRNKTLIWSAIIITTVLSGLALTLSIPVGWPPNDINFHQRFISNLIMACTHTAGALLFIFNRDVYKADQRRAYLILAIGALVTGGGTLQISVLTIVGFDSWYVKSGATILPFLLSGLIIYLGLRSFAKIVKVQDILTKAYVALPLIFLIALATTLLPHADNPAVTELNYDILVGIFTWSGGLMLIAGWLAFRIRQSTGMLYIRAMTWLVRTLCFSGFVLLFQGYFMLVNTTSYNPTLNLISDIITITSGLLWIRAGYAFALTTYYSGDMSLFRFLFSSTALTTINRPRTVVDMVTYAASLASNARDIDPLLDKVRAITSKLKPGESPSIEDSRQLVEIYLKIEDYLTTKEAARNYNRKELRTQLDPLLERYVIDSETRTKTTE